MDCFLSLFWRWLSLNFVNGDHHGNQADDSRSSNLREANALLEDEHVDKKSIHDPYEANEAYKARFTLLVGNCKAKYGSHVHKQTEC